MGELTKEIDYQSLVKEYENGVPISYICEVHQNQSKPVTVEYFYDLVHTNCSIGSSTTSSSSNIGTSSVSTVPLDIADTISLRLVQRAAEIWKILPNGESCLLPTMFDDVWLVGISTVTTTTTPSTDISINHNVTIPITTRLVSDFGCQVLVPNTTATHDECCHVIRSKIIFRPSGGYNKSKLESFVKEFIDSSSAVDEGSLMYRTASIEPQFVEDVTVNDEARNNLNEPNRTSVLPPSDPAVNAITQQSSEDQRSEDITVTGGFLIASFISVMIGVFIVLFRRHRSSESTRRRGVYDHTVDDTFRDKGEEDDDDFRVTVVNDPNYNSFPVRRQLTCLSCVTETDHNDGDAVESELLENDNMDQISPKYAFDLGQSLKMKVMGTYAPTTIPVVAPYPLNGSFSNLGHPPFTDVDLSGCDSEAEDSWAQTDGTVGSIEERLEEITAEI